MTNISLCPRCGEPLEPNWDVCWKCADEETPDPANVRQLIGAETTEHPDDAITRRIILGTCAVAVGLFAYSSYGLTGLVTWLGFVALLKVMAADIRQAPRAQVHDANDESNADLESSRTELADRIANRAFQAALFGLIIVPPLAIYALYLAARIRAHRETLSPVGRRRRTAAVLLAMATVGLWVGILAGMEVGVISEFFRQ